MNVALVDGKTGKSTKQLVFDLYGKGEGFVSRKFVEANMYFFNGKLDENKKRANLPISKQVADVSVKQCT